MRSPREAAIFVSRGDRYLVCHRTPQDVWNVVAGQVEAGETFAAAARRELGEETGLDAAVSDLAFRRTYPVPDDMRALYPSDVTEVTIESFAVEAPDGWEPTLNHEHDAFRWCTLAEALELLHWPEMRDGLRACAARRLAQSPGM